MALLIYILVLLWTPLSISAGDDCKVHYKDDGETTVRARICWGSEHCCGSCEHRHCCSHSDVFTEDAQEQCYNSLTKHSEHRTAMRIAGIVSGFVILIVLMVCWRVPSCWIYKMCRMPQPAEATSSHRTERATIQQYPGYQPGNPLECPMETYGTPTPHRDQPMASTPQTEPASASFEPPPSYEDAVGCPVVNHSGAAFAPGQQSYPIPTQDQPASQATAPTAPADVLLQPAYNPNYAAPPPANY